MRSVSKPAVLVCGLMISSYAWAQGPNLSPPPKRNYKYDGKVVSTYDKTKDATTVLIQLMPVKEVEDPHPILEHSPHYPRDWSRLELTSFFVYSGQRLVTPKYVSIGIVYLALDPQRYESHVLAAKIDGDPIVFGKMDVLRTQSVIIRFAYKPYTRRTLEIVVPYEQLLRLANAKKVKLKLGDYEFSLSKDHMDAIKDLASRTVP
jgi:hypothetical protein